MPAQAPPLGTGDACLSSGGSDQPCGERESRQAVTSSCPPGPAHPQAPPEHLLQGPCSLGTEGGRHQAALEEASVAAGQVCLFNCFPFVPRVLWSDLTFYL